MPSVLRIAITSLILLALVGLIEWGAWRNVDRMWSGHGRHAQIRWAWWGLALVQFVWMLVYFFRWPDWRQANPGWLLLTHAVLISLVVPKLFLCGVELLEGLRYWGQWAVTGSPNRAHVPRRTFITMTGQAAAGLLFVAFANGMTRGRHGYHVRRHEVPIENLPEGLDGVRIVQISDAHLGSFLGEFSAVQPGLDLIQNLNPDVLCFTGDLVNDDSEEAEPWIDRFRALQGRYGKFSILGNHDYADYSRRTEEERNRIRSRIRAIHDEMGFDLLLNTHRVLDIRGEKLLLVGVENWGKGFRQSGNLNAAMAGADASLPTVLLSHDPTHWEERVMGSKAPVELTLSGHTHGMQMGLEIPSLGIKFSPSGLRYKRWGGLYTEGKQHLHVNRGFGMLGFPGRVGMPPEITELTLRQA